MGVYPISWAQGAATRDAASRMQEIARRHIQRQQMFEAGQARDLLGVGADATPDDIRAAFARKVKESHPDAGGSGGDLQQLKQARNVLLEACRVRSAALKAREQRLPFGNTATMQSCQMCGGSGRVAVGFDNQRCNTCNGAGEVPC